MKQHITPEDLNQLSESGKQKLREWWKPQQGDWIYTSAWVDDKTKNDLILCMSSPTGMVWQQMLNGALPLLSIGQMVEFLTAQKSTLRIEKWKSTEWLCGEIYNSEEYKNEKSGVELCKALWSACVEVLNK